MVKTGRLHQLLTCKSICFVLAYLMLKRAFLAAIAALYVAMHVVVLLRNITLRKVH